MTGKSKCRILKDIRRQIARENDIAFVTSECKFQGECSGTCPKCETELRFLEQELENRQKAGKAIAVAGIAAALMVGVSGCAIDTPLAPPLTGDVPYAETATAGVPEIVDIPGDVAYVETTESLPNSEELLGDAPYALTEPTETTSDGMTLGMAENTQWLPPQS